MDRWKDGRRERERKSGWGGKEREEEIDGQVGRQIDKLRNRHSQVQRHRQTKDRDTHRQTKMKGQRKMLNRKTWPGE